MRLHSDGMLALDCGVCLRQMGDWIFLGHSVEILGLQNSYMRLCAGSELCQSIYTARYKAVGVLRCARRDLSWMQNAARLSP